MTDFLIVGAGILGLSHAYAAARRGLRVKVFERSATPLGASVRNFGQALVSGQPPGQMLDLARASRPLWAHWAEHAGFALKRNGSLLLARTAQERDVLEAFCDSRAVEYGYPARLLEGAELNALYDGRFSHHRAALHGLEDQQLYSREALPTLVAWLREQMGVEFHFSTLVRDIEPGRLSTTAGTFSGGQIVVCSGHDYQTLLAEPMAALQPQVCRLQMLRARPRFQLDLQHSLLTGLSCLHYGAYADLPQAAALRERVESHSPHLLEHGIHLLISPTPHGELIIGDSHAYGSDASPFNAEQVDNWMIELAEHTLGGRIEVVERWQGVYGSGGPGPFSLLPVAPGISAALMHTGVGMSVGPALAEQHLARLLGEVS
ncbi:MULTISPECIES: TIGR03364 family FAD-dependent oxidoreductase [unclassified Pseudomonas]|uniref:TIGR03364 family FAD-dependent oxidoreductase n=1 Tax=unclassified Pseudomonas TaxID=196821 RepID=UPI000BA44F6B|nr:MULTISPECIES: TIGR03364 family FAD-dependent oxidoreductase [unclassified Pseudomonas]MCU1721924.1 TIGR03364 family FAD-dependent oxidoreductase [Pseudomonas sp. 5P_5.1_Bac1]